jgi:hypothetical protein
MMKEISNMGPNVNECHEIRLESYDHRAIFLSTFSLTNTQNIPIPCFEDFGRSDAFSSSPCVLIYSLISCSLLSIIFRDI